jgi:hypothetical protein
VTLEKIYREIVSLSKRIETLELMFIPHEELSPEELEEIDCLEAESLRDRVPWSEIKSRVEELLK